MNILKFMWYLVTVNLDFSMRTARRQMKELTYGILGICFIMLFCIFVGFVFDMLTFYKFYNTFITDNCTTIIQVFALKWIQGMYITFICGCSYYVFDILRYTCKREWENFNNKS